MDHARETTSTALSGVSVSEYEGRLEEIRKQIADYQLAEDMISHFLCEQEFGCKVGDDIWAYRRRGDTKKWRAKVVAFFPFGTGDLRVCFYRSDGSPSMKNDKPYTNKINAERAKLQTSAPQEAAQATT